jgi:hypothetical protein
MSSRTEQTEYSVLKSQSDYEIRLYPTHIVAETMVTGSYQSALNQGFRILAGYIFGGNTTQKRIAMTAPVTQERVSESIAMTAPVTSSIEGNAHTIRFGMPRSYTLKTLPVPTDKRVKIITIPEKKMAALQFSWGRSSARIEMKKQELLRALQRDDVRIKGEMQYAGYNAPWTLPWMNRHEILVEIA